MSDGLVVMVGKPIDCKTCNGSGRVPYGFVVGPQGPICPDCKGSKFTYAEMPLEDFAKLFTTITETDGKTYSLTRLVVL